MKKFIYKIGIHIALLIIVTIVQTYELFAETVESHHVVQAVGQNNAIVSSVLIGIGAVVLLIFDKMREDESSED
ncbi:hypothetical protein ACMGE9_07705 [Macrococcus sp. EM39E]|uniref:hypothetical protein n=1 Tax=Macrococcus animalis TaxID=3395467 RepID=UPI0039BE57F4